MAITNEQLVKLHELLCSSSDALLVAANVIVPQLYAEDDVADDGIAIDIVTAANVMEMIGQKMLTYVKGA